MIDFERHRSDKIEYLYNQIDVNLNFHKHTHRSFEFVFVYSGELLCEIDGQIFRVEKNKALLIMPGQIHSYTTENHCNSYLCVFSCDWVQDFYNTVKGNHFENPVIELENADSCEILQNENSNKFLIKSILYGICSKVFSNGKLIKTNEQNFALANSIAFFVQDNYRNNINLKMIATNLGYNYSYLSSFFNEHFGMSFSQYVNSYRIQFAKEYLIQTDKKITEISALCGFETIRNFNRIFKNEFGITPSEYKIKYALKQNQQ